LTFSIVSEDSTSKRIGIRVEYLKRIGICVLNFNKKNNQSPTTLQFF